MHFLVLPVSLKTLPLLTSVYHLLLFQECLALYFHPQYIFMAWCLVKHRDNFTFTLVAPIPIKLMCTMQNFYKTYPHTLNAYINYTSVPETRLQTDEQIHWMYTSVSLAWTRSNMCWGKFWKGPTSSFFQFVTSTVLS